MSNILFNFDPVSCAMIASLSWYGIMTQNMPWGTLRQEMMLIIPGVVVRKFLRNNMGTMGMFRL